jgi:hypothetical protein
MQETAAMKVEALSRAARIVSEHLLDGGRVRRAQSMK